MRQVLNYTSQVGRLIEAEGISPDELQIMVESSAMCTGEGHNRRYHHWLFDSIQGKVNRMFTQEALTVGKDSGKGFQMEDHERCDGLGCHECGYRGTVLRWL